MFQKCQSQSLADAFGSIVICQRVLGAIFKLLGEMSFVLAHIGMFMWATGIGALFANFAMHTRNL